MQIDNMILKSPIDGSVEVPNKGKRPAGEHVTVAFPASQEKTENTRQ